MTALESSCPSPRSRLPISVALAVLILAGSLSRLDASTPAAQALQTGLDIAGSVTPSIYQLYGVNDRREWQVRLTLTNRTEFDIVFGDDLILVESDESAATFKGVYHSRGRSAPPGGVQMTSESPRARAYSLTNFDHQWSDGSAQGYCEGGTYTMRDATDDSRQKDPDKLTFGHLQAGATKTIEADLLQGVWLKSEHASSLRIALPELIVGAGGQQQRIRAVVYFSKPPADGEAWPVSRIEYLPVQIDALRPFLVTPEENPVTRVFAANWMAESDPQAAAPIIAHVSRSVVSGHLLGACLSLLTNHGIGAEDTELIDHAKALVTNPESPDGIVSAASRFLDASGSTVPDQPVARTGEPASQRSFPPTPPSTARRATAVPHDDAVSPATAADSDMTALQTHYVAYLRREGYQPEIDDDGDVRFKREGFTYYVIVDDTDLEYFRILFPGIWIVEDSSERDRALAACSRVNRETKVAKAYLSGDRVNLAVEMLLPDLDDVAAVFPRSMRILAVARDTFNEAMAQE
jgi:hypothetical protein